MAIAAGLLGLLACGGGGGGPQPAPPANAPPSISQQPSNQAVLLGQTATFTAAAQGTPAPTLQWRKDGAAIPNATSATYTIPAATKSDHGAKFSLGATNPAGSASSTEATLTVHWLSITTQPLPATVVPGATASFTVAVDANPPATYQWRKNGTAVPGATSATWSFTAAMADNGASIDCSVSNSAASLTTNPAALTVNPVVYTITASAGANGSISPSGGVSVAQGANQAFAITPGAGYHVLDVLVDGASVGAALAYTFNNVQANHSIAATFALDGPPPLKTVAVAASATLPQPGSVPTVVTAVTHNLHSDPNAINAAAGRAALLELDQDFPMVASHDYSGSGAPNSAPGVWNFRALDGMIDLLTGPGLRGTLAFNPIRCPAYMAMGGVPGHRPANNAQFGAYCARLVQYYNTAAGFTDGATTYKRTPVHIKYWELWGEANINEFTDDNHEPDTFDLMTPAQKDAFLSTPALYRAMYDAAAGLMKAADPTILVGGPGITGVDSPTANAMGYINELLRTAQPLDFVGYHDYGNFERATSDQDAFLEASTQLLPFAQQVQAAIAASSHPNARIIISEGNGNGSAYVAPVDHRANNIFDVPYLASLLRGYVLLGVDAYERFEVMEPAGSNVFAAVDSTGTRSPAFYGWKLLNQQLTRNAPIRQSQVADPAPVSGQPTVDSLAFQPSANTLTVLLINKTVQNGSDNSAQDPLVAGANVTAIVTITGRTVASATLSRVDSQSQLGIDTQPVAVAGGTTVSVPLRGYGITFLVLRLD